MRPLKPKAGKFQERIESMHSLASSEKINKGSDYLLSEEDLDRNRKTSAKAKNKIKKGEERMDSARESPMQTEADALKTRESSAKAQSKIRGLMKNRRNSRAGLISTPPANTSSTAGISTNTSAAPVLEIEMDPKQASKIQKTLAARRNSKDLLKKEKQTTEKLPAVKNTAKKTNEKAKPKEVVIPAAVQPEATATEGRRRRPVAPILTSIRIVQDIVGDKVDAPPEDDIHGVREMMNDDPYQSYNAPQKSVNDGYRDPLRDYRDKESNEYAPSKSSFGGQTDEYYANKSTAPIPNFRNYDRGERRDNRGVYFKPPPLGTYMGHVIEPKTMVPPYPLPDRLHLLLGPYQDAVLEVEENINIPHYYQKLDYYYLPDKPPRRSMLDPDVANHLLEPVYSSQGKITRELHMLPYHALETHYKS
jgi:hypothetical protein